MLHAAPAVGAAFAIGDAIALTFGNRDTGRYPIQEMLRAERVSEPHRIQDVIDVYNELLPGAGARSATI